MYSLDINLTEGKIRSSIGWSVIRSHKECIWTWVNSTVITSLHILIHLLTYALFVMKYLKHRLVSQRSIKCRHRYLLLSVCLSVCPCAYIIQHWY